MNIALISRNRNWKIFILSIIDLKSYKIDDINFYMNKNTLISKNYDLVLLDINLAEQSLFSLLLFKIRLSFGWSPHLISLSPDRTFNRNFLMQAVSGGADDFLDDAFDIDTVLSKLSAITRRRYLEIAQSDGNLNYSINVQKRIVLVNGAAVKLNDKEFELFLFFYGNTNSVFDRQSIYNYLWTDTRSQSTRTLDTHISRIRKILKLDGSYGLRIKPVYGVGYMMKTTGH
jgi:DNA-binding response OmpR family regulator